MPKPLPPFAEYLRDDLLAEVPGLEIRAMMGAYLLRRSGTAVGILDDGRLYFKAGPSNADRFDQAGMPHFSYRDGKTGREVRMSYREVPLDVTEDRERLREWLDSAYAAALTGKRKAG